MASALYLLPLFLDYFSVTFPQTSMSVREMTTVQVREALKTQSLYVGIVALPLADEQLEEV